MRNSKKFASKRDWNLVVVLLLGVVLLVTGMAYKHTGEFGGAAKSGATGQTPRE
jgi:hypothetical protein